MVIHVTSVGVAHFLSFAAKDKCQASPAERGERQTESDGENTKVSRSEDDDDDATGIFSEMAKNYKCAPRLLNIEKRLCHQAKKVKPKHG